MDVPARARLSRARSAPPATIAALAATLAIVVVALAIHVPGARDDARRAGVVLGLFTVLFGIRVAGQLLVLRMSPRWLPPMEQWNLVPYPILLPIQLVLLVVMTVVTADLARGAKILSTGPNVGFVLVGCACAYAAAMVVRYVVRMARRPEQRWFGGAIPIVFHCVLAAWLFVLALVHVGG